jgi:peptide/nickel transport system permease protein
MTILVLFVVIVFLTLLVHITPGDAAKTLLGPRANEDLIAKVRASMDLDKPIHVQIANAVLQTARGDLGTDIFTGRQISELVGAALPHTLILAWAALGLATLIGVPLGVYSATHPDSWLDRVTAVISISFITIPSYVAGLFLLLLFAVQLQWMPAIGLGEEGDPLDYIKHLILPATALAITWVGYLARLVRASLLEVLNQTYIRAAMAAGLSSRQIFYKYALKNAARRRSGCRLSVRVGQPVRRPGLHLPGPADPTGQSARLICNSLPDQPTASNAFSTVFRSSGTCSGAP